MPITIDPKNPSIPSMYGVPAQDTPAQGQSFVTATNTGTPRVINPLGTTSRGGKMGRGYGPNELPPLDDYFKSRALLEKVPSLSSIDNQTATSWANDYAQHFIAGALEGTYQRKVDKNEIDSHVARFNMQFANRLADFKAHLAQLENAGALSTTKPEDESNTSKFIKDQLGAAGDVPYQGGLDNPLTRGLAQSGNEGLSGLGYVAGHPANTAKGLLANSLPVLIARKLSEKFKPEESQQLERFIHQNSDDPAVTKWVNEHFINPLTSEKFSKEGEQLQTPASASAGQAALQFGSKVAGTLAQAGAGGEGAAALGASRLGARAAAAASYGVPAAGAAAQSMEDQGKKVDPEQLGKLISTAVATGLLPASLGGSLLKRLVGGAAIGVGANAASNTVEGNPLTQGALPAAVVGAGFGALPGHAGAKPSGKPGEKTPPPAAPTEGAAPPANDAYTQAYQGVVESPEHQVKPGTPLEQATPTFIEALDQFNARYGALHEEATPEQRAQASAKFEDDWKKQFNVQEEKPQAQPQVKEVTPENKPISDQEAAQAVGENPALDAVKTGEVQTATGSMDDILKNSIEKDTAALNEELAKGSDGNPELANSLRQRVRRAQGLLNAEQLKKGFQGPPQATSAPETPVEPPVVPGEAREAAEAPGTPPGEARESAPAAGPIPVRELATMPGVDPRLPLGVTERVASELRDSLGRDPTAKEISDHAGLVLDEAMRQKGVDNLIPALARREAVGQLLEEHPTEIPEPEAINKRARKLQNEGLDKIIANRSKEFEKHPAVVAKKEAEQFRNALKKARQLPDTQAAGEDLTKIENIKKAREEATKAEAEKAQAAEAKKKSDEEFRKVLAKARTLPTAKEKSAADFRNVLQKAREMPPPKTEAASQEGDTAHSRTTDSYGHRVSGRNVDELRQTLEEQWGEKAVHDLEKSGVLRLVQSMGDLAKLEPKAVDPKYVTAGYYNGRSGYLVADHIRPGEEVGVLMHEIGTHYGLKRMLPSDLLKELREYVRNNIDVDKELTQAYKAALESNPNPRLVEEETIAHMVQANAHVAGSIWRRAWTAVKAFVYRTLGKYLPTEARQKLLDNDVIRKLVQAAAKPQGKDIYLDVNDTAYSRVPTNLKTAEQISRDWNPAQEPDKTRVIEEKIDKWTDRITKAVDELYPLQKLNRDLEKSGVRIAPEKNAFMVMTNLQGRARHEINSDIAHVLEPAKQELFKVALENGVKDQKGFEKFIGDVTNAIGGRHALDVNKLLHYTRVRLTPEAEVARSKLLLDVFDKKLPPKEWWPQLKKVVNTPGAIIEKGPRMGSGIDDTKAYQLIKLAKDAGISDQIAERINKAAFDPVRQRTLERGIESGNYTPEQRKIVEAYGSKWYLPFKGYAEDSALGVDNTRRPMGAFNKDTTAAREGRQTQSNNPIENLFRDLSNSSKDVAFNEAARTFFKMANDPAVNKKLGIKVKAYDINQLTRDALASGSKLSDMSGIFRDPNSVIYKNGKDWFVMQFPEGSRELAAIKSIEKDKSLKGVLAYAGRVTNFMARAKTTFSPVFTLWNALWRDTTGYPILAALDHGPAVAAGYVGNVAKFGGPLGAWRTYANVFRGVNKFETMEQIAKEEPNSLAGWAYDLSKHGGSLDFKSELSAYGSAKSLAEQMAKEVRNPLNPAKLAKSAVEYLDALATSSIALGRVSMYKALVESGKLSRLEAAHYVKRMENFEQTSEMGRQLNAFFPFWRAGVTQGHRMYDLVHKPNGDFDKAKFGKIMMMGAAAAAAYWNFVLKQYYGDDAKKIKLSTLTKNFILPNPWGEDPIEVPMGLGVPRLMLGLGIIGTRAIDGSANASDIYESTKQTLFENLTPLKPTEAKDGASAGDRAMDLLAAIVPGAFRAEYDLARNQTTFGKEIYTPESFNDNRFLSDTGRASTPEQWKTLAKELRELGGVDVHPESLQYLVNSYGQGYLTELLRTFALKHKEETGHETSVTDVPFIPRVFNRDMKFAAGNEFYANREHLKESEKQANSIAQEKGFKSYSEMEKAGKTLPTNLQKNIDEEKKLESAAREHSKAVKEIDSNHLLSSAARAQRLAQLNAQYKHTQEQLSREVERMQ